MTSIASLLIMDNASLNLIRTKLHRPLIGGSLIHRPRLIEPLERDCDRPLTLVSAAAGSGKTMLLSDWLTTRYAALDLGLLSKQSG